MYPLEVYYLNQAGRGLTQSGWLSLVYSALLYSQREHGIGNYSAVSSAGYDSYCGAETKLWVARRFVSEARS